MNRDFINYAGGESAKLHLYGPIGMDGGISGADIASAISWLSDDGVEKIAIHINSYGGSIADGWSILAAMLNSKAEITAYIDGIAASIASVIALGASKVVMKDFALIMMHNPLVSNDGGKVSEKTKKVLELFRDSLLTIYENRTGMDRKELGDMLNDETWMNARQAKKLGFVDEIIKTQGRKAPQVENLSIQEIFNYYEPNNFNMKEIAKLLNLADTASEGDISGKITEVQNSLNASNAKIEGLNTSIEAKDAEIEALTGKVTALESADKERSDAMAEALVNDAVSAKKIKNNDETVAKWVAFAKNDYEGTKEILNSLATSVKLSDAINNAKASEEPGVEKEFKGLSVSNVMREIDAKS